MALQGVSDALPLSQAVENAKRPCILVFQNMALEIIS